MYRTLVPTTLLIGLATKGKARRQTKNRPMQTLMKTVWKTAMSSW